MNSPEIKHFLRDRILDVGYHGNGERIISPKGGLQNWMIDLRHVFLNKDALKELAEEFWKKCEDFGPFQIGGMETAAIPMLTALLLFAPEHRGNVNGFIIRKERKSTGLGRSIEGEITDVPIVLVDDILNSGSSAEKARITLETHGVQINHIFVVIDYHSKKGLSWREEHDIDVLSLFTLNDFGLSLRADEPPPPQRYRLLWQQNIQGGFPYHIVPKSAPVLVEDVIFRGSDSGIMHAFDAKTGKVLWAFQATGTASRKGIWSSPAYHDGRIYFGAYNGVVYCLDARTGGEIWVNSSAEWVGASPIVLPQHNLLYIGLEYERPWAQGSVCALSLTDGKKVWEHLTQKFQHGSPAYWKSGDLIIWGTADHVLTAFDARTGNEVWGFKTGRSVKYAPAIDEEHGIVAFASFDKCIYVLDVATGKKLGAWETGEICYTTPLIHNRRLFCGSGDKKLYVIDLDSMEVIKVIETGARVYSSPQAIENRVLFGTNGGRVFEIDADTLEIMGILQLPDAITNAIVPSLDGRTIYVSTYMNHLFAFDRL